MIEEIKKIFGIGQGKLYKVTEDGDWKMINEEGREVDRDGFIKIKTKHISKEVRKGEKRKGTLQTANKKG